MKNLKRILIILLIFTIIVSTCGVYASSDITVIYDDITSTQITSGISRDYIKRYTTNGMQSINILKVDLNNSNVKIDSMNNLNMKKDTVGNIANSRNAIAAINGSFFQTLYTDSSKGISLEAQVESSGVFSAQSGNSNVFGTFAVNNLNEAFAEFWQTDMKLVSSTGYKLNVIKYNKTDPYYLECVVQDRKFAAQTAGAGVEADIVEMLVENGVVKEVRKSMPKTDIPQNGYVVITRMSGDGQKLIDNFKVGDKVTYDIKTNPSWTDLKMSITGGSILVQDGKIPFTFSHTSSDVSGRHPRTAIGSSKNGKIVYLVVVDGRQPNVSIGMTQTELAKLMLDIGSYDALNLDGGGSTTMVTRPQGEKNVKLINTTSNSGNAQRIVTNAVGIFSVAPPGELDGFYITPSVAKTVTYGIVGLNIKGFDTYLNPHDININEIVWKIDGPSAGGEIRNGKEFVPFGEGKYTLTAKIGNATGICEIEALGYPVSIEFKESSIVLGKNEKKQLIIEGITKDGYRRKMWGQDIQFHVNGNVGVIDKDGNFTASGFGVSYVMATYRGVKAYCKIKGSEEFKDEFENGNGYWSTTGKGVTGKYSLTSDENYAGGFAGKLEYNFLNDSNLREASLAFNKSYTIDNDVTRVGLWVMTPNSSNSLNIVINDSKGVVQSIPIISKMSYNGWAYAEADLNNISRPATIKKISVVRKEETQDIGVVYLDDLRFLKDGMFLARDVIVPKDTPYKDADNIASPVGDSSYTFSVFGQNKKEQILLHNVLLNKLVQSVNANYDGLVMVGKGPHTSLSVIAESKFKMSTGSSYSSLDVKSGRLIYLKVENGSFRIGDSAEQWRWFVDKITNFTGKEIFIFMQSSPDLMTNVIDKNLFKQLLSEQRDKYGRKIWVFFDGDRDGVIEENGVKYVTSMGYEYGDLHTFNAGRAKQIVVTVKDNKSTYTYVPLLQQ